MNDRYPQLAAYQSLFPQSSVITTDFSKLENRVMVNLLKHRGMGKSFKDAVYYGTSIHQLCLNEIEQMPRTLFSFHPARNNQVIRTIVQTVNQLQEAIDDNPDFTHISVVNDGKHWLIHKGHVNGQSAIRQGKWKPISFNRLPKPIKMLLVLQPLGE